MFFSKADQHRGGGSGVVRMRVWWLIVSKFPFSPPDDDRLDCFKMSPLTSRDWATLSRLESSIWSEWILHISPGFSPTPSHQSWMGTLRSKVSKLNKNTQNPDISATRSHSPMVWSVLDVAGSIVWESVLGSQSGIARAFLEQNGPHINGPELRIVGRWSAFFAKFVDYPILDSSGGIARAVLDQNDPR